MLNWHTRQTELQTRFFKPPPMAYLWVDYKPEGDYLSWCFNFMDLGMCHSISSKAIVKALPDGTFLVDGLSFSNEDSALDAVFGGHYSHFIWELYRDLGVKM